MSRLAIFLGSLLLLSALSWGEETTPPTAPPPAAPEPKDRIVAVLATVKPGDDASCDAAENTLMAENDTLAAAIREAIRQHRDALAKTPGDPQLTTELDVLDGANLRLSWGWQPNKAILDWTARLKDADGNPFRVKARPRRIHNELVDAIFTDQCFFTVQYPPATVPSLPQPLQAQNLFIVGKDGLLKYLAESKDLEAFFHDIPAPVAADDEAGVKKIVRAWLRLTEEFSQDGQRRFTLAEDSLKTSYRESTMAGMTGWRASGQVNADPKTGIEGFITVSIVFSDAGKVKTITEDREIRPAAAVPPPAETPATPAPAADAPPATNVAAPAADNATPPAK